MRCTATRGTVTRGEASAITGSRLSAGVFHSDSRTDALDRAPGTKGSSSGVQNRIAAPRRSSRGNQLSAIAARVGRMKISTSSSAAPA